MKRQWRQTVQLAATSCLFLTGSAMAATVVDFPDNDKNFPGYKIDFQGYVAKQNDQINNPVAGGMTVIFDDNRQLLSVSLPVSDRLVWDTLFINNTDYTSSTPDAWNYVILDTSGISSNIRQHSPRSPAIPQPGQSDFMQTITIPLIHTPLPPLVALAIRTTSTLTISASSPR